MENGETKLSEHFRLREFTRSRYADIYNVPPPEAVDNLRRLCQWLEMLREMYLGTYCTTEDEARIIVNSGYRSQALNFSVDIEPGTADWIWGGETTFRGLEECHMPIMKIPEFGAGEVVK